MRTLLPDLRVNHTPEGDYVVAAGGRYFAVSKQTATLLNVMKESATPYASAQVADRLSTALGFDVSANEVEQAVNDLPEAFFGAVRVVHDFRWSVPLLHGHLLDFLARHLSILFAPLIAPVLCLAAIFTLWQTNENYSAGPTHPVIVPVLVLVSILFHELGHAAACRRGGAKPSLIGIGVNGLFPAFYTDVSDIWVRGKWARVQVDIGGIYFQFLYAAALTLWVPWYSEVLSAISLTLLLAAFSCLPYFRFDGYWLLGDLLGTNDLKQSLRNTRQAVQVKYRERRFSKSDVPALVGIVLYYGGMVAVLGLTARTLWQLVESHLGSASQELSNGAPPLGSLFMLLFVLTIFAGLLRKLFNSVQELRFLAVDLPAILRAMSLGFLTRLARPFLHLPSKHHAYFNAVMLGMCSAVPPVPDPKRQAQSSIVTKYQELFWFQLLSRVSVGTGLWLVRRTHRIKSVRTLSDVIDIPGPVILAAPHYGSFISGAMLLLSSIGSKRPIHLFYADPKTDPENARYEQFYRRYFPDLSVCFNNKRGIINAVKALKRGEILVIMPDVFQGPDLIDIELMGRHIGTMAGIAFFYHKFGAMVMPVLSRFNGFARVDIHVGEILDFKMDADSEERRLAHTMERLFAWFANWFQRYPDNWHCWDKYGQRQRHQSIAGKENVQVFETGPATIAL
jgi:putative peptide zinc metalloprotease protein